MARIQTALWLPVALLSLTAHSTSAQILPFENSDAGQIVQRTDWALPEEPAAIPPATSPSIISPPAAPCWGPTDASGTWVLVAPYAWLFAMNGQVTTYGRTTDVNVDLDDSLNLIKSANGALQLHAELGRNRWGLILDTSIMRLSPQFTTPAAQLTLDLQQSLFELLGTYRLVDIPAGFEDSRQSFAVDLLGGTRYYLIKNGVTIDPVDPMLPTLPLEQSRSWVDLVVGARARAPLLPGLDAFARGDIGGFHIGTSSNLAWNLVAGLDWQATDCCSLVAGYRLLDIDESQGMGTTAFGFDVKMQGPFMALALRF